MKQSTINYVTTMVRNAYVRDCANKIVNHSDVVEASPVGAATSSFSTKQLASMQRKLQDETRNISVLWFGAAYIGGLMVGNNWYDGSVL